MPQHLMVRLGDKEMVEGNEAYPYLPDRFLLTDKGDVGADYRRRWARADAASFAPPPC